MEKPLYDLFLQQKCIILDLVIVNLQQSLSFVENGMTNLRDFNQINHELTHYKR